MNPEYPFQPQQPGSQPQPAQPAGASYQPQAAPGAYGQPQQYVQAPINDQPYPLPGASQPPVGGYAQPQPQSTPPPKSYSPKARMWMILSFVFIFTTLGLGGLSVWAAMNYYDQKNNVDIKVDDAVSKAVKDQSDKDAAAFLEKEKQPNRQFAGPDDYGRLSFDYPKTWSVYEAKDATKGGTYEVYLNPGVVPPIDAAQQYALHVTIENKDYDKVLDGYKNAVQKGELRSTGVTVYEQEGARLEGNFTKDIRGMAVIFKIRDKTVTIRSDAETFRGDFDALIKTITFNK